ncbi:MAG: phenylalanine--tRNA ligase subunit beta [Parcubacteria group bacterium CG11_big_fil_rev_8_21_14_0_20_39_14]|nr:MAG: phenylalanine--tRNA ligase subunit beta [Parcubacteria group bacterium CG11_big_fil_rev_8_21_14_0_20_39_14]PIS35439.1 MAG: phenylalanine--tRNA ligase subunit beta [Parcubacteria group bacterium CG08_land_8_20_14_0_20_38_56]
MKFSYNWLKEYVLNLPEPEKLAELLTLHSFEVGELKKVKEDFALDIDVLPNRAHDCLSHIGIARECGALINSRFRLLKSKLNENKKLKTKALLEVEVKDKKLCPRYTARIVQGVKVGPSPKWLKERLKTCGYNPINNVVDATNYVMLESGQSLHAFDFDKIKSLNPKSEILNPKQISNFKSQIKKIIVRRAKRGEKIITLDGGRYVLDESVLIIADINDPLAIAGIKGGKKAEIDAETKNIILESANFNPLNIRRSSGKLSLQTDSSFRFERQIDPNLTSEAIDRVAALIQKMAGGDILSEIIDVYPQKARPVGRALNALSARSFGVLPKRIRLDLNYVQSLLGLKIPEKEIRKILERINLQIIKVQPPYFLVEVPTFRQDITLAEDLIEEIARIYGYQRIPGVLPQASLIPPKRNYEIFWEDFSKNILKEAGFSEIYNYSFIGEKEADVFGYNPVDLIELENPMSLTQSFLRPSLICNLLKNVKENLKHFDEIKIFELGRVFRKIKEQKKIIEKRMLTGVIAGKRPMFSTEAFYEAKGVVDLLLSGLGITEVWYDEYQPTPEDSKALFWHKSRCAELKIGHGKEIGFLGELNNAVLEALGIKIPAVAFEIDFEKLQQLATEEQEYRPISRHPAVVRDLAILVPFRVRLEEVLNKIEIAGGKLLRDTDIFDIYEGEELPQGRKNLAFHLIFQAEDRTLSPKEINELLEKIIKTLEEEPEWEVRK